MVQPYKRWAKWPGDDLYMGTQIWPMCVGEKSSSAALDWLISTENTAFENTDIIYDS